MLLFFRLALCGFCRPDLFVSLVPVGRRFRVAGGVEILPLSGGFGRCALCGLKAFGFYPLRVWSTVVPTI